MCSFAESVSTEHWVILKDCECNLLPAQLVLMGYLTGHWTKPCKLLVFNQSRKKIDTVFSRFFSTFSPHLQLC